MFAPHVSPLNASPHRQRIDGGAKSHLGDEELGSVSKWSSLVLESFPPLELTNRTCVHETGPKKLFSDLRGTSTGRAFGDKTNMSPSRSRNTGQDGFAPGPSKPTSSKTHARSRSPSPTQAQSRGTGANLGSPAKASGKSQGVVFLGAGRSPSKQKGKARDRSKSPSKGAQHEAVQPPPPPPADASYVTSATPAPSSSHLLRKASSFITPASNVGEAGARRMRYGEMMDALAGNNLEDGSADPDLYSESRTRPMTEEELYPEIEYMAPSHCAKGEWDRVAGHDAERH